MIISLPGLQDIIADFVALFCIYTPSLITWNVCLFLICMLYFCNSEVFKLSGHFNIKVHQLSFIGYEYADLQKMNKLMCLQQQQKREMCLEKTVISFLKTSPLCKKCIRKYKILCYDWFFLRIIFIIHFGVGGSWKVILNFMYWQCLLSQTLIVWIDLFIVFTNRCV